MSDFIYQHQIISKNARRVGDINTTIETPTYTYFNDSDFNNRNQLLTAKLLKKVIYHKLSKSLFSNFYYSNSELIVKYNIGLKHFAATGHIRANFYGNFVYKFKRIFEKPKFSDHLII